LFYKLGFHEVHGVMVNSFGLKRKHYMMRLFFFIGFIDFDDQRDAADAVKALDGK